MLVLTRKRDEFIKIGSDIVIRVIKTGKGSVKIGIDAPDSVRVMRGELATPEADHPVVDFEMIDVDGMLEDAVEAELMQC